MTILSFFKDTAGRLAKALNSEAAGEAAARIIFEDIAGYDRKYLFMNGDRELLDFTQEKIEAAVGRVEAGEPVQYAVGTALFMGNRFKVTPAVLIPRPETAGLVDIITDRNGGRSDLRILDIGTGSGIIAISLAKALPFCRVSAIDISDEALAVAAENASALGAKVIFDRADILTTGAPDKKYDIIVSNPPYVCDSERAEMDARVVDFEPAKALFVPDTDPMLFYRAIAAYAGTALVPGGSLYLEINERFPEETRTVLRDAGFEDIDIIRDFRGRYRYATARKPS